MGARFKTLCQESFTAKQKILSRGLSTAHLKPANANYYYYMIVYKLSYKLTKYPISMFQVCINSLRSTHILHVSHLSVNSTTVMGIEPVIFLNLLPNPLNLSSASPISIAFNLSCPQKTQVPCYINTVHFIVF